MTHPRLSIIIPTRNEEQYIGRTLAHLTPYLEKYKVEIIVSDAHSSDATAEIVARFQAETNGRIRLVQRTGKQNIAIGRNFGAIHARGEILFHMDADVHIPQPDYFFPTVLASFERSPIVAATVPLWVYLPESSLQDDLYHLAFNILIRLSFLLGIYLAKGECQLVRRCTFEKIGGYNERLVTGEDCNLFYRLHKKGRIAYLDRLCVHHSPRRFRKYGYTLLSLIYLREGLSLLLRSRSYVEEWEVVR